MKRYFYLIVVVFAGVFVGCSKDNPEPGKNYFTLWNSCKALTALQRFPGGVRFEKGQGYSIRLDNLIALLRAVQRLDDITEMIPDIPQSLYAKKRKKGKGTS